MYGLHIGVNVANTDITHHDSEFSCSPSKNGLFKSHVLSQKYKTIIDINKSRNLKSSIRALVITTTSNNASLLSDASPFCS